MSSGPTIPLQTSIEKSILGPSLEDPFQVFLLSRLGAPLGPLGTLLGRLGVHLGCLEPPVGSLRAALGLLWAALGRSWGASRGEEEG